MKLSIVIAAGAALMLSVGAAQAQTSGYRVCGPLGNGIAVCSDGSSPAVAAYPSVSVGYNAGALNGLTNTTAVGPSAFVSASTGTALGANSSARDTGSTALGANALSSGVNSVAIGQGSDDSGRANVFSVGSVPSILQPAGITRQIINVAAGTVTAASTDAINGSQLFAVQQLVTQLSAGGSAQSQAYTDSRVNPLATQVSGLSSQVASLSSRLSSVAKSADAGTAAAIAGSNIPQATSAGRTAIGGAVGSWNGQAAFALGASHLFEGGKLALRGSANFDSRGSTGGGVGFGYQF